MRSLFWLTPRGALGFFLGLDALPRALDVGWAQPSVSVAEDMRVSSDHLACDRLNDVAEGECVFLFGHACMKHYLQQQIAEFVSEIVQVATRDGISDFVGFFDRVGRNTREILFEIPRAAGAGCSQRRHDFEQA